MNKFFSCLLLLCYFVELNAQPKAEHNLYFDHLAARWDEAMPLGNGMLGALVWQKENKLHISFDRADLWDERQALDLSAFNFKWVKEQLLKNQYDTVHKSGDDPYETYPYPTKLPAAALEFDIASFGKVVSNELDIKTALNTVKFENGVTFHCYIHASKNQGYFGFENLSSTEVIPQLTIPGYNTGNEGTRGNSVEGQGLERLRYAKETVTKKDNSILYHQPTYNGHYYEVLVTWKKFLNNHVIGTWTISNNQPAILSKLNTALPEPTGWNEHIKWWNDFWNQSSVSLPDKQLERQYYLELYKLGCIARKGAPAITLQASWTADNGNLPPWKGDFHNDLNTQLSYWLCYAANHLQEAATFTDWLWKTRDQNKKYTKQYFGVEGLNVPGVETLNGYAMGGWIQYSLSPTVAAWLSQHFYWQWKYSMDTQLLLTRTYPYLHDAATFLENITELKNRVRYLPLSSSPEYNDNDTRAWFLNWTNYDLSLAKFLFSAASEVSNAAGKTTEAKHWSGILNQLPGYDVNETGLTVAPGQNMDFSHRHMSPYMSIFPLAILDINKESDKNIIESSLKHIQQKGTRAWMGYSFSWMASIYARSYEADSAVKQLQIFASNFCSVNSFHVNGDQKGGEYSDATYRPFTLEGNFAFAEGIHELLLQSRSDVVEVFPAVPQSWKNVSFNNLRAEGAFLMSAKKENGTIKSVKIVSEKGGLLKLKLPFKTWIVKNIPRSAIKITDKNIAIINMRKGQSIVFENGYE
jgi:alpha-L-fucosidase 2